MTNRVTAYSSGAPKSQCESMTPSHYTEGNDIEETPFSVQVSESRVAASSPVTVMLGGDSFKGFLLQAQDTEGKPVGTFTLSDDDLGQYLACNGPRSAVTHQDSQDKTLVTVSWKAPSDFEGDVVFVSTFVQSYFSNFWVKVPSTPITVG